MNRREKLANGGRAGWGWGWKGLAAGGAAAILAVAGIGFMLVKYSRPSLPST